MDSKEYVNLYLDICNELLTKLTFDKSASDNSNQHIFFVTLDKSMNYLADEVLSFSSIEQSLFSSLNSSAKWNLLSDDITFKNIIKREFEPNGFLYEFNQTQEKLFNPIDQSIIISNDSINLKKFISILDKYKEFMFMLRKTTEEC